MSFAHRSRLALEPLDARIVPAVINLTTHGAESATPTGAIVRQSDAPVTDPIHPFVRMQSSNLVGGLLGGLGGLSGLLGTGIEQGYNTDARSVQFNENADPQLTRSLRLGDVPVVIVNGVAYREFGLTINQSASSPNLSVDEVRVYLGEVGDLKGYSASTKRLAGHAAVFDLDGAGDVSIRLRDGLNPDGAAPDMVLLVPDAAFAGATEDTFVYLYSKLGGATGAGSNGGFEEWSVREAPPSEAPPETPPETPPALASLSGFLFVDGDGNGIWDAGESTLAGVSISLWGQDFEGNSVWYEVQTADDGSFTFKDVVAGTYTLSEQPLFGFASGTSTAGTEGGEAGPGEITNITLEAGDAATGYLFGEVYSE